VPIFAARRIFEFLPVTREIVDFRQDFDIFFGEVSQDTITNILQLTGLEGPHIMQSKFFPPTLRFWGN